MKIELLGALDYDKLNAYLNDRIKEIERIYSDIDVYLDGLLANSINVEDATICLDDILAYLDKEEVEELANDFRENVTELKTSIYDANLDLNNYIKKLRNCLSESKKRLIEQKDKALKEIKQLEIERRTNIVSTAGRLSRYPGTVFEILETIEGREHDKNVSFAKRVIGMGHTSITEHDYCVFAIENVSPIVEQTIIAERFSSFTIKSRREVDFSKVGYYVPNFRDEEGNIILKNEELKNLYKIYMDNLFETYSTLVEAGIPKEDARFVLPYSYYSNIIMGIDAHTLEDMIIKFTKTKYSKIQELREFGEKLYDIAKVNMPYLIEAIDSYEEKLEDPVEKYLSENLINKGYEILDAPKLLNKSENIDDTILISALMRRYQYSYELAKSIYESVVEENPEFKNDLMRLIAFDGDAQELTQVNFQYQIPLSLAVLTHLTRHRTHDMLIPDFAPNIDLEQYLIPPTIKKNQDILDLYERTFIINRANYYRFKSLGVCDEDLAYFTLSGILVNVVSSLDGKTLKHILGLRECTKAQWETRNMAIGMHRELDKYDDAKLYSSVLGATCTTQGFCKEGKESCGRIRTLQK